MLLGIIVKHPGYKKILSTHHFQSIVSAILVLLNNCILILKVDLNKMILNIFTNSNDKY